MAEEPDGDSLLHRLFEQVSDHAEARAELFSLQAIEKLSAVAAGIAGAATVFVFAGLVLLFFSLGLGWWLGDLTGSRAGGFALAGLAFVPVGYFFNRWVRPFVQRKVIDSLLTDGAFFEKEPPPENPADHG